MNKFSAGSRIMFEDKKDGNIHDLRIDSVSNDGKLIFFSACGYGWIKTDRIKVIEYKEGGAINKEQYCSECVRSFKKYCHCYCDINIGADTDVINKYSNCDNYVPRKGGLFERIFR